MPILSIATDEINLRFYARRNVDGAPRRGVSFIREIVPRRAVAAVARLAYNEPYLACPTRSVVPAVPDAVNAGTVGYAWNLDGRWNALQLRAIGRPAALEPGSEEAFISEHFWGYTRQRSGRTIEYEVRHPAWRVWKTADAELECDAAPLRLPVRRCALRTSCSALLADGSDVAVCSGRRPSIAERRAVMLPAPSGRGRWSVPSFPGMSRLRGCLAAVMLVASMGLQVARRSPLLPGAKSRTCLTRSSGVTDPSGRPVAGVVVVALQRVPSRDGTRLTWVSRPVSATTNARGQFRPSPHAASTMSSPFRATAH